MSTGKVLLGILAGIAAGATLGILLAPDKGSNTRKKILKKGDDYAEELGSKFNDFIAGAKDKFSTVKDEAINKGKNAQSKAEETLADFTNSVK